MLTLAIASFFFFNDTATTEIYTLSLHDALPICRRFRAAAPCAGAKCQGPRVWRIEKITMPGTTAVPDIELVVKISAAEEAAQPRPQAEAVMATTETSVAVQVGPPHQIAITPASLSVLFPF